MFPTRSVRIAVLFLLSAPAALAGVSSQTDWSGGDGVEGPVTDWGDRYYTATNMADSLGGALKLTGTTVAEPVQWIVKNYYNSPLRAKAVDINGDGFLDVVAVSNADDHTDWWQNVDGSGTVWFEHSITSMEQPYDVAPADYDGDGDIDVAAAYYLGGADSTDLVWFENTDGAGVVWEEHFVDSTMYFVTGLEATDVDGDGYTDIVAADPALGNIKWFKNDGTGSSWTSHPISTPADSLVTPVDVYSQDIDGDGTADVVGVMQNGHTIAWWKSDGTGTSWVMHTVTDTYWNVYSAAMADFDGDGDIDVTGGALKCDSLRWFENTDGTGTVWEEHFVAVPPHSPSDTLFLFLKGSSAPDLDGDGDFDIAIGTYTTGAYWYENTGGGTAWVQHTVVDSLFLNATCLEAADINGDSHVDLLATAQNADVVSWFDVSALTYQGSGSLESSILDTGGISLWQTLLWNSTEPAGTSVAFQVRASDESSDMGAWSDTITAPGVISGYIPDSTRYFQYRVLFATADSMLTPVLTSVTVSMQTASGTPGENPELALYGAEANPSSGTAVLRFSLPQPQTAELTVFDVSGRAVFTEEKSYTAGQHTVSVGDLPGGVYVVRFKAGGHTDTARFTVID